MEARTKIKVAAFAAFLVIGWHTTWTPTESMAPTVQPWRPYPCIRWPRKVEPGRGDVVLYRDGWRTMMKRIIGLPGDTVEIAGGEVFLNGVRLDGQPYTDGSGVWEVGPGEMFVMGDNRLISNDSRFSASLPRLESVSAIVPVVEQYNK